MPHPIHVLTENRLFLFVWAIVAGVVSFLANQLAERLNSRSDGRRDVITATQTAAVERLISAAAQVCAAKSRELRSLEAYGQQLRALGASESNVTREQLASLYAATAEIIHKPLPSDSFVPPELASLVEEVEVTAAVAWVFLASVQDAPEDRHADIDNSLIQLDLCHKALTEAAGLVRAELWSRLRKAWNEAGLAPILAPIPLESAFEALREYDRPRSVGAFAEAAAGGATADRDVKESAR